jgi:hypothetical protein
MISHRIGHRRPLSAAIVRRGGRRPHQAAARSTSGHAADGAALALPSARLVDRGVTAAYRPLRVVRGGAVADVEGARTFAVAGRTNDVFMGRCSVALSELFADAAGVGRCHGARCGLWSGCVDGRSCVTARAERRVCVRSVATVLRRLRSTASGGGREAGPSRVHPLDVRVVRRAVERLPGRRRTCRCVLRLAERRGPGTPEGGAVRPVWFAGRAAHAARRRAVCGRACAAMSTARAAGRRWTPVPTAVAD